MTDLRDPRALGPDRFEPILRGLLHEQGQLGMPATLLAMAEDAMGRPLPRRPRRAMVRTGALAALAAVVVVIVAVGMVVGRPHARPWSVGQGGDSGPAIDWDGGGVRLEADSLRIEAMGTFTGTPDIAQGEPAIQVGGDSGSPTYRTLEVEWRERGVPMRLYLYLAADDTHWWVSEMRTYDGSSGGEWISYPGPLFRTPLGGTWSGDFARDGRGGDVPGSLRIDGLRLTAFAPGTGPAPLSGCQPWHGGTGQSLPDGLVGARPAVAAARMRARGICFEFRWDYVTGVDTGFAERWCVPPPTGQVSDIRFSDTGVVVLLVPDDSGVVREVRDQPPAGWGCPSDQRVARTPEPTPPMP